MGCGTGREAMLKEVPLCTLHCGVGGSLKKLVCLTAKARRDWSIGKIRGTSMPFGSAMSDCVCSVPVYGTRPCDCCHLNGTGCMQVR